MTTSEQELLAELMAVIDQVYERRPHQRHKVVLAFEEALAERQESAERIQVIAHWLDFYQAQRYRRLMRRRRATDTERMTACTACGYPVSQRHHLWDVATHGENRVTVQLCANCHELHHLMYNALARDSAYSQKLVRHVLAADRLPVAAVMRIVGWLRAIMQYEIDNGWLEAYKLSDLWIEAKLGWNAYVQAHLGQAPTNS